MTPVIVPDEAIPTPDTSDPSTNAVPDMPPKPRGRGRPPKDPTAGPRAVTDVRGAAAEVQKLQDFKRAIGPSLGPEGTVLANEKRRRGFLDDEDFEDVVESDVTEDE